jgi:CHASE3 domain sensor protein
MNGLASKGQSAGRLFLAGAVGLALVVTLFGLALASYAAAVQTVDHTLEVREQSYQWGGALVDAETSARAYLSESHDGSAASYDDAIRRARSQQETLRALVSDSPSQLRNVAVAAGDADAVVASLDALVALGRAGRRDEARARLSTFDQRARDAFRADGRAIRAEEARLLVSRRAEARTRGIITLASGVLIALASCTLLWAAWRRERAHDRQLTHLAEEAQGRLDALSDLAVALSEARTRADVAAVIVEHSKRVAGADICTLYELDAKGTALELSASRGVAPELLSKIQRISETSGAPATFASLKTNRAMWAESEAEYASTHPGLASMRVEGARARAYWSMPLVAEGRAVGLLGAGFHGRSGRTSARSSRRSRVIALRPCCARPGESARKRRGCGATSSRRPAKLSSHRSTTRPRSGRSRASPSLRSPTGAPSSSSNRGRRCRARWRWRTSIQPRSSSLGRWATGTPPIATR